MFYVPVLAGCAHYSATNTSPKVSTDACRTHAANNGVRHNSPSESLDSELLAGDALAASPVLLCRLYRAGLWTGAQLYATHMEVATYAVLERCQYIASFSSVRS